MQVVHVDKWHREDVNYVSNLGCEVFGCSTLRCHFYINVKII